LRGSEARATSGAEEMKRRTTAAAAGRQRSWPLVEAIGRAGSGKGMSE
jgi:hypothetical protein